VAGFMEHGKQLRTSGRVFLTGPPGEWFPPLAPEDLIHELCKKIMQRQMRQDWKLRLMISSRPCKSTAITWIVWPPITS